MEVPIRCWKYGNSSVLKTRVKYILYPKQKNNLKTKRNAYLAVSNSGRSRTHLKKDSKIEKCKLDLQLMEKWVCLKSMNLHRFTAIENEDQILEVFFNYPKITELLPLIFKTRGMWNSILNCLWSLFPFWTLLLEYQTAEEKRVERKLSCRVKAIILFLMISAWLRNSG